MYNYGRKLGGGSMFQQYSYDGFGSATQISMVNVCQTFPNLLFKLSVMQYSYIMCMYIYVRLSVATCMYNVHECVVI